MSRKLILITYLILALVGTLALTSSIQLVEAKPKTWTVDDDGPADFSTIQEAVEAVDSGDTIIVLGGHYVEGQINLYKSVRLITNGSVVVDGFYAGNVFYVTADSVTICGFTILNSRYESSYAGIYITSQENNITRNTITNNFEGIYMYDSSYNSIGENTVTDNHHGVYLDGYSSVNDINGNTIKSNNYGVVVKVRDAMGIGVYGNNITNNAYTGIVIDGSSQTFIVENNITDNKNCGVLLASSFTSIVEGNTIENNKDLGIGVVASSNIHIRENTIRNHGDSGIFFSSSSLSMVDENNLQNNGYGIHIKESNRIDPYKNNITRNDYGIYLSNYSTDNYISINNLAFNQKGLYLEYSSDNCIWHNNLINNTDQVYSSYSLNTWNYENEGNYWSDYDGSDNNTDGLGDRPYVIDEHNQDSNPLMGLFCSFQATTQYPIAMISNSTISDSKFNGTAIDFYVSGENDTIGFCRIRIPTGLMTKPFTVFVNGAEVSHDLLPCSDETYSYLYFTYNHSTQEVVIIPEFPSLIILLLFMIATLLAVIIYRRKHSM